MAHRPRLSQSVSELPYAAIRDTVTTQIDLRVLVLRQQLTDRFDRTVTNTELLQIQDPRIPSVFRFKHFTESSKLLLLHLDPQILAFGSEKQAKV